MKKIFNNFLAFKTKLKQLKKNKKKIVLCHGVFDLYHIGHLNYFEEAKKNGDILVVSLTSDRFVIKAPSRPYFKYEDRARLISSIYIVDFVLKSDSETSVDLINFLKPDIYFKGPDYKDSKKDITGNILNEILAVKKNKGRIIYGTTKSYSSSKILNKLENLDESQRTTLNYIKKKYSYDQIEKIFDRVRKETVLVLGEAIIDKFVFCKNIGRSGKESIQTLEQISSKRYVGGSLAIANNISKFVKKVKLLTTIGDNNKEVEFCSKQLDSNVNLYNIKIPERPVIEKSKIIDLGTNQKLLGLYKLDDQNLKPKNINKFKKKFLELKKNTDTLVIADYGHGIITDEFSKFILNKKYKHLYVNTQLNAANFGYHTIGKYSGSSYAIINEIELRHEMRDRHSDIKLLAKKMAKRSKIKNLIITAGNQGSFAYSLKENKLFHCAAFAVNVIDKIGAGDSFMSMFTIIHKYCNKDFVLSLFISSLATIDVLSGYGNENTVNFKALKKRVLYLLK